MSEGKRPGIVLPLVGLFALLTGLTVFGFSRGWRTEVASEEGAGIDAVLTYLLLVTGVLVVVGHAVLCWFLWRSSGPGGDTAYGRPSRRAEWLWSLIPVLIMSVLSEAGVLLVGAPVWNSMYVDQPEDPLIVEVVGKQFEWYSRYPGKDGKFGRIDWKQIDGQLNPIGIDENDPAGQDDIWKAGGPVFVKGRSAVLRLRTHDVIHSFFVPQFRLKQDLIPGFPTRLKVTPNRVGTYDLVCAELCGYAHYNMKSKVEVMTADDFEGWLDKQIPFGD